MQNGEEATSATSSDRSCSAVTSMLTFIFVIVAMAVSLGFDDVLHFKYTRPRSINATASVPHLVTVEIGFFRSEVCVGTVCRYQVSKDVPTCGTSWAVTVAAVCTFTALAASLAVLVNNVVELAKEQELLRHMTIVSQFAALTCMLVANAFLMVVRETSSTNKCLGLTLSGQTKYTMGVTWSFGLVLGSVVATVAPLVYVPVRYLHVCCPSDDDHHERANHDEADESPGHVSVVVPAVSWPSDADLLKRVLPPYWTTSAHHRVGLNKVEISDVSGRCKIQDLLDATCRRGALGSGRDQVARDGKYDRLLLHRVWRLENANLFRLYAAHRDHQISRPVDVLRPKTHTADSGAFVRDLQLRTQDRNEVLLWHGTRPQDVDRIATEGFDERVGRLSGLFGAGVYFADEVSKSDQYATPTPAHEPRDGVYTVLLVRVTMGTFATVSARTNDARRAPAGCHSIVGQIASTKYQEFVTYDGWLAYPEYVVQYKRRYASGPLS